VEKPKWNVYCPTHEHPFRDFHLIEWLQQAHLADHSCAIHPPELILSETQHASLIHVDPRTLNTARDITILLQESEDLSNEWSAKLFEVVKKFEGDYIQFMGQSVVQKRGKQA
jgi:hypothetical protein